MKMRLRIYTSLDDLSCAYDSLYAAGVGQNFFYSRPWFENFVQYALDPGDEVRIYCLEREDAAATPVAALLTRRQQSPATRQSLRTLSSLSNYYTTRFEPLLDPAYDYKGTLRELVRAICEERPRWDAINLQPMDRDGAFFSELVSAFE